MAAVETVQYDPKRTLRLVLAANTDAEFIRWLEKSDKGRCNDPA